MPLIWLEVHDLRIIKQAKLAPCGGLNLIVGPNASGKTSLLEAIYLLGTGRSFRAANPAVSIRHGETHLTAFGKYQDPHGNIDQLGILREPNGYQIRINSTPQQRLSCLAKIFPLQVLSPDTHYAFLHSAQQRRAVMDWGLFHVEPSFHELWLSFRQSLKQRNALLRTHSGASELAVWDRQLSMAGEAIQSMRARYLAALTPFLEEYGQHLLNQSGLSLQLRPGWRQNTSLLEALTQDRERDTERGFTHSGPHRADLLLKFHQTPLSEIASHGQQKLGHIALHLAQLALVIRETHIHPALLLDDLPAELDSAHSARLGVLLSALPLQVFTTAQERSQVTLDAWQEHSVFHVEHGRIIQE